MFRQPGEPTKRHKTGHPAGPRRLRVEVLESRTLLSAVPFAANNGGMGPAPHAWPPSPLAREPVAEYDTAASMLQQLSTQAADDVNPSALLAALLQDPGARLAILHPADSAFAAAGGFAGAATAASSEQPPWAMAGQGSSVLSSRVDDSASATLLSLLEQEAIFRGGDTQPGHSALGELDKMIEPQVPGWLSPGDRSGHLGTPPWDSGHEQLDPIRILTEFYSKQDNPQASLASSIGGIAAASRNYETSSPSGRQQADHGGLIDLTDYSLLGMIDTSSSHSAWSETVRPSQTSTASLSNPATEIVLSSGVSSDSDLANAIGTSDAGAWSEGGMIEFGPPSSALEEEESAFLPSWLRSSLSPSVEEDVVDLLRRRYHDHISDPDERDSGQQDSQPQPTDASQAEISEESAAVARVAAQSAEGGMIELVAMTEESCQASPSAAPVARGVRGNGGNIRIDRGLGLYRAFELATSRSQAGQQASPLPEAGSADSPATEKSAASVPSPATRPDQNHAAAAPAMLVVSLVSGFVRAVRGQNRGAGDMPSRSADSPARS